MMTKKDYIRAAESIRAREWVLLADRESAVRAFVAFFQGDNPRFDVARFTLACNDGLVSARAGTTPRKVLP